jgi:hypothetical protein
MTTEARLYQADGLTGVPADVQKPHAREAEDGY